MTDVSLAVAEAKAARGSAPRDAALQVRGLGKRVPLPDGELVILEDIGFRIAHGDTVAVVTVRESQIAPLTANEMLHVRTLVPAPA